MASKTKLFMFATAAAIAVLCIAFFYSGNADPTSGDKVETDNRIEYTKPVFTTSVATTKHITDRMLDKIPDGVSVRSPEPSRDLIENYQSKKKCFFLNDRRGALETTIIQCESLRGIDEVHSQYEMCSSEMPTWRRELAELDQNQNCNAPTEQLLEEYLSLTKKAAVDGVADAQLCFIESMLNATDSNHKQAAEEYDRLAPSFVENAFKRGDWRIVALLNRNTSSHTGLLNRLTDSSLQTRLRMNRLLRFGAYDELKRNLDVEAELFRSATSDGVSPVLTPDDIIAADRWASKMYASYFRSSSRIETIPKICAP